jgi:hypothetical protein
MATIGIQRFSDAEKCVAATLAAAIISTNPNNKGDQALVAAKIYFDCLEAIKKEQFSRRT